MLKEYHHTGIDLTLFGTSQYDQLRTKEYEISPPISGPLHENTALSETSIVDLAICSTESQIERQKVPSIGIFAIKNQGKVYSESVAHNIIEDKFNWCYPAYVNYQEYMLTQKESLIAYRDFVLARYSQELNAREYFEAKEPLIG